MRNLTPAPTDSSAGPELSSCREQSKIVEPGPLISRSDISFRAYLFLHVDSLAQRRAPAPACVVYLPLASPVLSQWVRLPRVHACPLSGAVIRQALRAPMLPVATGQTHHITILENKLARPPFLPC